MTKLLTGLTLLLGFSINAQDYSFWVTFTDKDNTPYSIQNPEEFLSQRSIDRRTNQGIAITEQDLPVDPAYVQYLKDNFSLTVRNTSKWFNAVSITTQDSSIIEDINLLSFVSSSQHVNKFHIDHGLEDVKSFNKVFNTERLSLSGERSFDYGMSFDQVNQIGGVDMHDLGFQGQGLQIAVLDAGFPNVNSLAVFDSLRTNGQILDTWDFVNGDESVYELHSHGTMVLSTMGGFISGELIGTAPKASYHLYITEDAAFEYLLEEDNWIAGAERADSVGADICNTSLGYTEMDDPVQSHEYSDLDGNTLRISIAADIAASKGMLMVNSAGNSGDSPWYYIGAPADGDSVLTVGAVNTSGELASFSSRGPSADGDLKPNVVCTGWDAVLCGENGNIFQGNGTSFSGPIMAGMAACLWQSKPDASSIEIKTAIEESSHLFTTPNNDMGYGIPNFLLAYTTITGNHIEEGSGDIEIIGPNPFSNYIKFDYFSPNYRGFINISIYNSSGQLLLSQVEYVQDKVGYSYELKVDSELSNGVYFLSIVGDDFYKTLKMVKCQN